MKSNAIDVLVYEPGKTPETRKIRNELEDMQKLVGGLIEVVVYDLPTGCVALVCNEEGKIHNLPANRYVVQLRDVIAGTFFMCGTNAEEFCSLTMGEINALKKEIQ